MSVDGIFVNQSVFRFVYLLLNEKDAGPPMFVLRILLTDNSAFFILRLPYSYAIEILTSCVLSKVVSNLVDVVDVLMVSTRKLSLVFILLRCTKWAMKYSCPEAIVWQTDMATEK
jgi:hypothetical protein